MSDPKPADDKPEPEIRGGNRPADFVPHFRKEDLKGQSPIDAFLQTQGEFEEDAESYDPDWDDHDKANR